MPELAPGSDQGATRERPGSGQGATKQRAGGRPGPWNFGFRAKVREHLPLKMTTDPMSLVESCVQLIAIL